MRRWIFVRPAKPEDAEQFLAWSLTNKEQGDFDPEVAKYPSTVVLCAYDQSGPLAYMPLQQPIMQPFFLESLAARPGLTKGETAAVLKEFTQAAVTLAEIKGVGEIYFLGTEEGTDAMAANQMFEKLPYSVYRVRVKDLEGRAEQE